MEAVSPGEPVRHEREDQPNDKDQGEEPENEEVDAAVDSAWVVQPAVRRELGEYLGKRVQSFPILQ
jgi:hypothetical protein